MKNTVKIKTTKSFPLTKVLEALSNEQLISEVKKRGLDECFQKNDDEEHCEPLRFEDLKDLKQTVAAGDLSHLSIIYSRLEAIAR